MKKLIENRVLFLTLLVLFLIGAGATFLGNRTQDAKETKTSSIFETDSHRISELEAKIKQYEGISDADQRLGQYVINMMYMSRATVENLSQASMLVLAKDIVRVANDIFDDEMQKKGFVTAVQIESRFLKYAQSPTGPKGLSQVARATFHEALAACGIPSAKDSDAWDVSLNLYAGACYFRKQLLLFNNDPLQAIVAYNQGSGSADSKSYARDGSMSGVEPLKYIAKFVFLQSRVTDQKTQGVPSIQEMPKPDKNNVTKTVAAMKAKDKANSKDGKQRNTSAEVILETNSQQDE